MSAVTKFWLAYIWVALMYLLQSDRLLYMCGKLLCQTPQEYCEKYCQRFLPYFWVVLPALAVIKDR